MWITDFKHDELGVCGMIHSFGNGITVETNIRENRIMQCHGGIIVKEWESESMTVKEYTNLLNVISGDIEKITG